MYQNITGADELEEGEILDEELSDFENAGCLRPQLAVSCSDNGRFVGSTNEFRDQYKLSRRTATESLCYPEHSKVSKVDSRWSSQGLSKDVVAAQGKEDAAKELPSKGRCREAHSGDCYESSGSECSCSTCTCSSSSVQSASSIQRDASKNHIASRCKQAPILICNWEHKLKKRKPEQQLQSKKVPKQLSRHKPPKSPPTDMKKYARGRNVSSHRRKTRRYTYPEKRVVSTKEVTKVAPLINRLQAMGSLPATSVNRLLRVTSASSLDGLAICEPISTDKQNTSGDRMRSPNEHMAGSNTGAVSPCVHIPVNIPSVHESSPGQSSKDVAFCSEKLDIKACSDDEDELCLRYKALQSAMKKINKCGRVDDGNVSLSSLCAELVKEAEDDLDNSVWEFPPPNVCHTSLKDKGCDMDDHQKELASCRPLLEGEASEDLDSNEYSFISEMLAQLKNEDHSLTKSLQLSDSKTLDEDNKISISEMLAKLMKEEKEGCGRTEERVHDIPSVQTSRETSISAYLDPVDMEISDSCSEAEEIAFSGIKTVDCFGTRCGRAEGKSGLQTAHKGWSDSNFVFPIEWAYMIPPPPSFDQPDNIKSVDAWCYNQNMCVQTMEASHLTALSQSSTSQFVPQPSTVHVSASPTSFGTTGNSSAVACSLSAPSVEQHEWGQDTYGEQALTDFHAAQYEAFMTAVRNHDRKTPEERRRPDILIDVLTLSSKDRKSGKLNKLGGYEAKQERSEESSQSLNSKSAASVLQCQEDEDIDEDVLRAQLLIEISEKRKHRYSSYAFGSKVEESKQHASKDGGKLKPVGSKIMKKDKPAPWAPYNAHQQRVLKPRSSKQAPDSRSTDIGGHYLDPKGRYYAEPPAMDIKGIRFPTVKPVVINLNEASSDEEKEVSKQSISTVRSTVLSVEPNTCHKNNGSQKSEEPVTDVHRSHGENASFSRVMSLMSETKQEEYRKLQEQMRKKKCLLEKRKKNRMKKDGSSNGLALEARKTSRSSLSSQSTLDEKSPTKVKISDGKIKETVNCDSVGAMTSSSVSGVTPCTVKSVKHLPVLVASDANSTSSAACIKDGVDIVKLTVASDELDRNSCQSDAGVKENVPPCNSSGAIGITDDICETSGCTVDGQEKLEVAQSEHSSTSEHNVQVSGRSLRDDDDEDTLRRLLLESMKLKVRKIHEVESNVIVCSKDTMKSKAACAEDITAHNQGEIRCDFGKPTIAVAEEVTAPCSIGASSTDTKNRYSQAICSLPQQNLSLPLSREGEASSLESSSIQETGAHSKNCSSPYPVELMAEVSDINIPLSPHPGEFMKVHTESEKTVGSDKFVEEEKTRGSSCLNGDGSDVYVELQPRFSQDSGTQCHMNVKCSVDNSRSVGPIGLSDNLHLASKELSASSSPKSEQLELLLRVEKEYSKRRSQMATDLAQFMRLFDDTMASLQDGQDLQNKICSLKSQLQQLERDMNERSVKVKGSLRLLKDCHSNLQNNQKTLNKLESIAAKLGKMDGMEKTQVQMMVEKGQLDSSINVLTKRLQQVFAFSDFSHNPKAVLPKRSLSSLSPHKYRKVNTRGPYSINQVPSRNAGVNQPSKMKLPQPEADVAISRVAHGTASLTSPVPPGKTSAATLRFRKLSIAETKRKLRSCEKRLHATRCKRFPGKLRSSETRRLKVGLDHLCEKDALLNEEEMKSSKDVLCSHDLLGRCNDDSCLYQHLSRKSVDDLESAPTHGTVSTERETTRCPNSDTFCRKTGEQPTSPVKSVQIRLREVKVKKSISALACSSLSRLSHSTDVQNSGTSNLCVLDNTMGRVGQPSVDVKSSTNNAGHVHYESIEAGHSMSTVRLNCDTQASSGLNVIMNRNPADIDSGEAALDMKCSDNGLDSFSDRHTTGEGTGLNMDSVSPTELLVCPSELGKVELSGSLKECAANGGDCVSRRDDSCSKSEGLVNDAVDERNDRGADANRNFTSCPKTYECPGDVLHSGEGGRNPENIVEVGYVSSKDAHEGMPVRKDTRPCDKRLQCAYPISRI